MDLVIFCHVKGIPSINFVDGENFAKELGLVVVAPGFFDDLYYHGNLRGPPPCHVYPQEIAGLIKGL